ncbi:MAG: SCO family protein [Fimbriimonadales bacterium]
MRATRLLMLMSWLVLLMALGVFVYALRQYQSRPQEGQAVQVLVEPARLQVLGEVKQPFQLTDQWGEPFSSERLKGKVWVGYFFFSTCVSVCPIMNKNAIDIQTEFLNTPDVLLVGFSVDPKNDTPEVLRKWGEKHNAQKGKWYFLTGDKETLYKLSIETFKLGVSEGDETHQILHSDKLFIVDRQGRIRGYYSGLDRNKVQELIADVHTLLKE